MSIAGRVNPSSFVPEKESHINADIGDFYRTQLYFILLSSLFSILFTVFSTPQHNIIVFTEFAIARRLIFQNQRHMFAKMETT